MRAPPEIALNNSTPGDPAQLKTSTPGGPAQLKTSTPGDPAQHQHPRRSRSDTDRQAETDTDRHRELEPCNRASRSLLRQVSGGPLLGSRNVSFFCVVSEISFGVHLGSIWARFWEHFGFAFTSNFILQKILPRDGSRHDLQEILHLAP